MFQKQLTGAALVSAIAAFATPVWGQAQPKVGDHIGDWVFNYRALSAKETRCALYQRVVEANSNRKILRVSLQKLGRDRKLALIASVPLGVYLTTGIAAKIDEGEQFNLIWQSCTNTGCQAALRLNDAQVAALKKGEKLFIGVKVRPNTDTFTVAASLNGVTAGLKALDTP
tara:strand:- start:441 stop:953 length:513 start_codon:yes stop_codon:yes gene_type:complete